MCYAALTKYNLPNFQDFQNISRFFCTVLNTTELPTVNQTRVATVEPYLAVHKNWTLVEAVKENVDE